jgi:hypothetical protein
MNELRDLHFSISANATPEDLAAFGNQFAAWQKGINWWLGDLARYAEARWPETWHQVFPEWASPGLIDRCKAVARAYAPEERNPLANWTVHMIHANNPDRVALVAASVEAGRNTEEERLCNSRMNRKSV